jgi:4-amino-4-deoxy-L-arabinose transferase-like glycosyltransferase
MLALALALRLLFLWLAGLDAPLVGDELAYQQIAENLASGQGFVQTNNPFFPGERLYAWQAPLYPTSLGLLYVVFGVNILNAKLLGILVSTSTVYIVYDLARRVFRTAGEGIHGAETAERIGLAAGLVAAIYPGLLTNAHLLLSETVFIFLLMLAFDLAAKGIATLKGGRRTWLWLGGAGILWGLATLTRGIVLYFIPLFALWIGFVVHREGKPSGRAVGLGLVFLIAALGVIAPWTYRNYTVFDRFVSVETKGGVNFWLGNSPFTPNAFIRNVWKVGVREPMLAALPPGEVERDRAAYQFALSYIRAEPLTFAARLPIKFADFWAFDRNLPDTAEATLRGAGWNSRVKLAADLLAVIVYMGIVLVGTVGLVFAPETSGVPPALWKLLLGGFILYYLSAHLVVFGDGRFHLPLIPVLILYTGWMTVMVRRIGYARGRVAAAGVLATILVMVWAREVATAVQILRAAG